MIVDIRSGYLPQSTLEEYMAADNEATEAAKHRDDLAERVIASLLKGVPVEPGIHRAEVCFKQCKNGKLKIKLKVK